MASPPLPRLLLQARDNAVSPFPSPPSSPLPHPSTTIVIGILTAVSLTFLLLLLLYTKHCSSSRGPTSYSTSVSDPRRWSGVNRSVISSLPVFRFSSLTGQKQTHLECAVCLSRFDPPEVLRLLPRCRHAFHAECVDTWLESHSTCPLCRVRVRPEDLLLIPDPSALPPGRRVSGRHSYAAGEKRGQLRFPRRSEGGGSCGDGIRKDGLLLSESEREDREEFERRFSHRIIVSRRGERWSDPRPSDLLYLRSEMMMVEWSGRMVNSGRSVSEITGVSRFAGPIRATTGFLRS